MKKQLFFTVVIYLLFDVVPSKAQCHIDDWTALKALYESTNGDEWEENEGWDQVKGNVFRFYFDVADVVFLISIDISVLK